MVGNNIRQRTGETDQEYRERIAAVALKGGFHVDSDYGCLCPGCFESSSAGDAQSPSLTTSSVCVNCDSILGR